MLYLDTSLLVAALTNETEARRMQSWLGQQDVDELAISDWVATEFSSAISIKLRTGQIRAAHLADALGYLLGSARTVLRSSQCRGCNSARRLVSLTNMS
jgi:uncharacterized protein with PIN domain